MTDNTKEATADTSRYADCTKYFHVNANECTHDDMDARENRILDNQALVELAVQEGYPRKKALSKIMRCGRKLTGPAIDQLRPVYYCKQYKICRTCAVLKAIKRVQRIGDAIQQFHERTGRNDMRQHNFLIKPRTSGLTENPHKDLLMTVRLLKSFQLKLAKRHRRRHANKLIDLPRAARVRRLPCTLGPIAWSMHLAGVVDTGASMIQPMAHLHVSVVTDKSVKKAYMNDLMKDAWDNAAKLHPDYTQQAPVVRKVGRSYITEAKEVMRSQNRGPSDFKASDYWVKSPQGTNERDTVSGMFFYLARTHKDTFANGQGVPAEVVLLHQMKFEQLMAEKGKNRLTHANRYNVLGADGTETGQLPAAFHANDVFRAKYADGWQVERRPSEV